MSLKVAIFVLTLAPLIPAQEQKPKGPVSAQQTNAYQAPVSCTANVPAALCRVATRNLEPSSKRRR
jgi:hypothetical protein